MTIDLRTCVPEQKLRLRNGDSAVYHGTHVCGHIVRFPGGISSYTDSGCYIHGVYESPNDVVEILPLEEKPMTKKPTIESLQAEIAKLKVELAAASKKLTGRSSHPPKFELGQLFRHDDGCVYMLVTGNKLVQVNNPDNWIGRTWSKCMFGTSADSFTYIGEAKDILKIEVPNDP